MPVQYLYVSYGYMDTWIAGYMDTHMIHTYIHLYIHMYRMYILVSVAGIWRLALIIHNPLLSHSLT